MGPGALTIRVHRQVDTSPKEPQVIDDITAVFVLPGFRVVSYELVDGELTLLAETPRVLVGCPVCGAVANVKDRRTVTVRDLPVAGTPVIVKWRKRVFSCRYALCENKTWTEHHDAVAPRAVLTERARQWAFDQVGFHDRAVSVIADQLGVAWHTIMTQVFPRDTAAGRPEPPPGGVSDRGRRDRVPAGHRQAPDAVCDRDR